MKLLAHRWTRLLLGLLGVIGASAAAPHALRRLDTFRVRHVEVVGTRLMAPGDALRASGIDTSSSVFDDPAAWRDSLRLHPLIADARVARKPPATIVIHVDESEPVALVRTPRLQPVDARGRVLPIEEALGELDVPVLSATVKIDSAGEVRSDAVRAALIGLADVRTLEPSLWGWISEVEASSARDMRLVLRWPADAELLLPLPVSAARLEEVRLVLADLAATAGPEPADGGEADLTRLRRLDARFEEQVIVSLAPATRRAIPREAR